MSTQTMMSALETEGMVAAVAIFLAAAVIAWRSARNVPNFSSFMGHTLFTLVAGTTAIGLVAVGTTYQLFHYGSSSLLTGIVVLLFVPVAFMPLVYKAFYKEHEEYRGKTHFTAEFIASVAMNILIACIGFVALKSSGMALQIPNYTDENLKKVIVDLANAWTFLIGISLYTFAMVVNSVDVRRQREREEGVHWRK